VENISERFELQPFELSDKYAVAKDFQIDGFIGTVSFITSMSDHFCGTCNRIRLTADGSIKSCLFHPAEVNLRSALRSNLPDDMIIEMIYSAITSKPFGHPEVEELVTIDNRSMIQIGG
jgi:cyclic pyranopterin phosphate synthase